MFPNVTQLVTKFSEREEATEDEEVEEGEEKEKKKKKKKKKKKDDLRKAEVTNGQQSELNVNVRLKSVLMEVHEKCQ
ncbi:unnamed protein product [Enterobius vermicularis]|uniref:Uncharacterized protein n=1 Tax=Enterobius vermicularis TaxID=51028 RepID=A0A0N4UZJ0_ENTVE|nr:unnamed protein product [Enterobius vermicularis]